jgi:hypothetical protein
MQDIRIPTVAVTAIAVILTASCAKSQFIQAGRKTILSINEAVTATDKIVAEHYKDAPLDDTSVDEALAKFSCAFTTIDLTMLEGWKILATVEDGPPKIKDSKLRDWVLFAGNITSQIIVLTKMLDLYGIKSDKFSQTLEMLATVTGVPHSPDVPEELDCSDLKGWTP